MKKIHPESCMGCRFAIEHRDHMRNGEQVRCAKAEQLFGDNIKGGKRWVSIRKGKNGDHLKSKCGTFEPFIGDSSTQKSTEPQRKVKRLCAGCNGSGQKKVKFMNGFEHMKCYDCDGQGSVIV
jgi:hypothetical protein